MSLLLAEKFIELSDSHTAMAKVYNDIADELSEAAALSHPAATGADAPHMQKEAENISKAVKEAKSEEAAGDVETEEEAAEIEAAEKKKAAAAKRRAAAKAKKEAAAVAEADTNVEIDIPALVAKAQGLTRNHIQTVDLKATRVLFDKYKITKVSEAGDDADLLQNLITDLTASLAANEMA